MTPQRLAPESVSGGVTSYAEELARAGAAAADEPRDVETGDLRAALAAVLAELASRTEPALAACLKRSREEWDQADSLSVIDAELADEIAVLRRRLAASAQPPSPAARRAVALEGLLVVDAAVALVRLFERRLAPLLRLRLRSSAPDLLPAGRPFLDLGAALHELAEAWQ